MQANFAIAAIPAGLRFHIAHDSNLMLFGWVSCGILRDAMRLEAMPDLAVKAPGLDKTAEEAGEFMFGLLKAEVGDKGLERVREMAADYGDEFGPFHIISDSSRYFGEQLLTEAFAYARAGRDLILGGDAGDDDFAASIWDAFAARVVASGEA